MNHRTPLLEAQIRDALAQHPAWRLEDGRLTRDFTFPTFPEAIRFVTQVAELAESANHHPDIDIRFNRVRLTLLSHDVQALTTRDTRIMATLDRVFPFP